MNVPCDNVQLLVMIFGHGAELDCVQPLKSEDWLPPARNPLVQVSVCTKLLHVPVPIETGLVYALSAEPWGTEAFVRIFTHHENAHGSVHQVKSDD